MECVRFDTSTYGARLQNNFSSTGINIQRFKNKVVIVTGAGSGIGEATARQFSEEGATVVLAGHTLAKLEKVASSLPAERTRVELTDVADYVQCERLIDATTKAYGQIDVLVSNAGIVTRGSVTEARLADWKKVMEANAGGVFNCARAALPWLIKSKGSIVNTASLSDIGGDWAMACYTASKGAILNLTRSMALIKGQYGVRVNAVCPSFTRTPMTDDIQGDDEIQQKFAERIALRRICEPREVAAAIAFLASDDASFITGFNLPVDGGVSVSNGQPNMS